MKNELPKVIPLPPDVMFLLNTLREGGHEAWAVGGCVRDSLLGLAPHDWDLCTSALPGQVQECFRGLPVLGTGLAHGTLTVLLGQRPYEITTYRRDGPYTDHRRPDQVRFVGTLGEDLARRDFTINAMAAGPEGIVDLFGGCRDLSAGRVRCVGRPQDRFEEDALRLLRALRFAARFGFTIEEATAEAMEQKKELLGNVSVERVWAELCGLLMGPGVVPVLAHFAPVLETVLPEIGPCRGFEQHHPTHDRDVWGHTLQALSFAGPDLPTRWALLLHDMAKPLCFSLDEKGVGHFYGHGAQGARLAGQLLARLKAPKKLRQEVTFLVQYHDTALPLAPAGVRSWLRRAGEDTLRRLLEVKRCDMAAHLPGPRIRQARENVDGFEALLEQVLAAPPLFTVRDLAISGRDLIGLGLAPGPDMGRLLRALFSRVEQGTLPNEKAALLAQAAGWLSRGEAVDGQEKRG